MVVRFGMVVEVRVDVTVRVVVLGVSFVIGCMEEPIV